MAMDIETVEGTKTTVTTESTRPQVRRPMKATIVILLMILRMALIMKMVVIIARMPVMKEGGGCEGDDDSDVNYTRKRVRIGVLNRMTDVGELREEMKNDGKGRNEEDQTNDHNNCKAEEGRLSEEGWDESRSAKTSCASRCRQMKNAVKAQQLVL